MFEVKMPKLGQTVEVATIVQWLKKEGDYVKEGEPLFTVQTDKAEIEYESPYSGTLLKILAQEGEEVPVLTVVALIGEKDEVIPENYLTRPKTSGEEAVVSETSITSNLGSRELHKDAQIIDTPNNIVSSGEIKASPRAKKTAEELGVSLEGIKGTGIEGRITSKDIIEAYEKQPKITPTAKKIAEQKGIDITSITGTGPQGKITKEDVEKAISKKQAPLEKVSPPISAQKIPLTPMRKIIAERMSHSLSVAPHYYVTVEIDMMNAKLLRERLPFKVSFNDIVLYATVRAIREYPSVNVQWGGDCIIQMPDINLGVAVALPQGLIVPVIKKAQELSLEGISKAAKELIQKAQNNKLLPDDYTGNTFTVSNLGPYGVDHFTAIINQPDSAILAVGQIKDRPVVIDGGIYIRPIMKITMSCDHRVIDGALGGQFMGKLKEILEKADFI
ncbi:MAG: 2-oxo acid dehydrogenase subunit E2 [Candidatus Hydrogenedentes bacterium]|nr:2-oxo acid dehydrogenase subunit E2 [Candidatus Hydrogenedentota bacterium]